MKLVLFLLLIGTFWLLVLVSSENRTTDATVDEYRYRRYSYRKKPKTEKKIKLLKQQCEDSGKCNDVSGVELVSCIRQCMSRDCYSSLYAEDELEEGEIDVRFNSFKGCVVDKELL